MESHLFRCQGIVKLFLTLGTCQLWPVGCSEICPLFHVPPMTVCLMDRRVSHLKHSASEKKKNPAKLCLYHLRTALHGQPGAEPGLSPVISNPVNQLRAAWIKSFAWTLHHYRLQRGSYTLHLPIPSHIPFRKWPAWPFRVKKQCTMSQGQEFKVCAFNLLTSRTRACQRWL